MAKGKKTTIKEIKLLDNDEISINGREYVVLETCENIETAKTMKISSNGNRILRFDDDSKKARIDVKRDIDIIKCTFSNPDKAQLFKKSNNKGIISNDDKKEIIAKASSYIKAREIIDAFKDKNNENFDSQAGITSFYFTDE